jgi:hypothetical protein
LSFYHDKELQEENITQSQFDAFSALLYFSIRDGLTEIGLEMIHHPLIINKIKVLKPPYESWDKSPLIFACVTQYEELIRPLIKLCGIHDVEDAIYGSVSKADIKSLKILGKYVDSLDAYQLQNALNLCELGNRDYRCTDYELAIIREFCSKNFTCQLR